MRGVINNGLKYFLQRSQFLVGGECLRWNIVQLVSGQVSENNKISIILWSQILTVAYKTHILFNCFAVWKAFCLISVILLFSSLLQAWNYFFGFFLYENSQFHSVWRQIRGNLSQSQVATVHHSWSIIHQRKVHLLLLILYCKTLQLPPLH